LEGVTIYIHGLNIRENNERAIRPKQLKKIYKKEHPEQDYEMVVDFILLVIVSKWFLSTGF